MSKISCLCLCLLLKPAASLAGVLPEDRADALYHSYDGGGVEVTGPSILVRKGDKKHFSVSGNYYVDSISSASIDVITQGSPYSEERIQKSIGVDLLHANTIFSLGYTNSEESDYTADTTNFSISHSLFGDLTTVTMGFALGRDEVLANGTPDFSENVDRKQYQLNISQVLTKDMILAINFENVTEEGFLNNPYRSVRYDNGSGGDEFQSELYPGTRTSNAIAARLKYYLPYRAALGAGYRYFRDDWEIEAHTLELNYTHPLKQHWTLDLQYRYYTQSEAEFYSDLFPFRDAQNFLARDKELSQFDNHSIGFGISYAFLNNGWRFIDKAQASFKINHFWFSYDNYRDLTKGGATGEEPLYEFESDVIQLFVSIWY
ncbi:MAG: DUF3570 domain-containing protein [Gammaproteobacteria bacterium]